MGRYNVHLGWINFYAFFRDFVTMHNTFLNNKMTTFPIEKSSKKKIMHFFH